MAEWGLRKLKPGFHAVFIGPPGSGKSLAAALLGKTTGRTVYRIDLALCREVETLARLFDLGQRENGILFFDEADALFAKRTSVQDANDRYAHQQTGYLLQRLEDFAGTVILASTSAIDEPFLRRFHSVVRFPLPNAAQRLRLWRDAFEGVCGLEPDVDLAQIAEAYAVTGGSIMNVLRHAALAAIRREQRSVSREDILSGLRREARKDGVAS